MRINQAITIPVNSEMITESQRFGNKEMAIIRQYSKDFRIGIEYEFHIDESNIEQPTMSDSEKLRRAYEESVDHTIITNFVDDLPRDHSIMTAHRDLRDAIDDVRDIFTTIKSVVPKIEDIRQMELDLPFVRRPTADSDLKTTFIRMSNALTSVRERIGDVNDGMSSLLKFIDGFSSASDEWKIFNGMLEYLRESNVVVSYQPNHMRNHIGLLSSVIISTNRLKHDPSDNMEYRDWLRKNFEFLQYLVNDSDYIQEPVGISFMTSAAHQGIQEFFENNQQMFNRLMIAFYDENYAYDDSYRDNLRQQMVDFVKDTWEDNPNIEEIHEEHFDGAEMKTKPLTVDDTFDLMKDVFSYIRDYGSTSRDTGMHVNISHKKFAQADAAFDALKMVVLIDPDFMQMRNPAMKSTAMNRSKLLKWEERSYMVQSLVEASADSFTYLKMIEAYDKNGINGLMDVMRAAFIQREKFRSINFTHMLSNVLQPKQRRIEFRFFGGNNYEDRYDDIYHDVMYVCYAILAAYEPKFLYREYIKGVLRLADRISKKFTKGKYGFLDAVVEHRKHNKKNPSGPTLADVMGLT